jgi:hypothetical protein
MSTFVVVEGRKPIPLPEEIASDDQAVLKALLPFYPEAAEAELKREAGPEAGDVTVKVIPRGKTKGGDANTQGVTDSVFASLREAPRHVNPAVALCLRIESEGLTQPEDLLLLKDEMDQAISQAEEDIQFVDDVLRALQKAPAVPAAVVVPGF